MSRTASPGAGAAFDSKPSMYASESSQAKRNRFVALLSLLVMGAMWGLQFSMLKFAALSEAGEIDLLLITLLFLVVAFSAYVLVRGESLRLPLDWLPFLLVIALVGYVIPLGITLWVAPHVSVGVLSLVACLAPVLTVGFALILRTEQVSLTRILAVLLGLASVMVILWSELQLPGSGAALWICAATLITLAYGFEPVYVHANWPRGMSSAQLIAGEAIVAAVLVFPAWLVFGNPIDQSLVNRSTLGPLLVFALAGIVETLLYFHLIRTSGGVFVSFGTFVSLFAGIAWGMVLFDERYGPEVWLAVGLLLGALVLSLRSQPSHA